MKIKPICEIARGQDGAIFGGYLFRLDGKGFCSVYRIEELAKSALPVSTFYLEKADIIAPHSNSVAFGNEFFDEEDEFPLLYTNIYNNYAKAEDRMKGVTCVYRLQRNGSDFCTTLVQLIGIGFCEDDIWKSSEEDFRPYGNFAIDREKSLYYAFTMRDADQITRYFAFPLPKVTDGVYDEKFGVRRAVLKKEDILHHFDCEYHRFMQGACLHDGKIYSLEGFTTETPTALPALRIIDPEKRGQACFVDFPACGLTREPELIDFEDGICYYADQDGHLYELIF